MIRPQIRWSRWWAPLALSISLCAIAAGCATPSPQETDEENRVKLRKDVDDEVTVGREIAAKLLGNFKNFKDPIAREYVNLVGQTIAKQTGRPELVFRFTILDTDDQNAYACPGGYIFITKGLLKNLKNESELGDVLAHEIAHVNEKHMYQSIMPKKEMGVSETIARLFTRGYGDLGASLGKIIDAGLKILLEEGYGKEKEFAADQAGVTYAATVGYDPNALIGVIQRTNASGKAVVVAKTHPPSTERIELLTKYLKDNGLDRVGLRANAAILAARFERAGKAVEASK